MVSPVGVHAHNGAMSDTCPCGSGRTYAGCCGPLHVGTAHAATAEALMRSRYSAFVRGDVAHLLATWHASTRPATLDLEPGVKWLGLQVRAHRAIDADHAEVEFVARSRVAGRGQRLHELSRFVREGGLWYYVDGDFQSEDNR